MARNVARPLSVLGLANVCRVSLSLFLADSTGDTVTVTYSKRDGSEGSATGAVLGFSGDATADTFSVTLDTVADKGRPTTVNIALIHTID